MTKHIRLVIADDHPVVRTGLQAMFASHPDFEVVGEAANGAEAVALTVRLCPDVVLMDLRDGRDGWGCGHSRDEETAAKNACARAYHL